MSFFSLFWYMKFLCILKIYVLIDVWIYIFIYFHVFPLFIYFLNCSILYYIIIISIYLYYIMIISIYLYHIMIILSRYICIISWLYCIDIFVLYHEYTVSIYLYYIMIILIYLYYIMIMSIYLQKATKVPTETCRSASAGATRAARTSPSSKSARRGRPSSPSPSPAPSSSSSTCAPYSTSSWGAGTSRSPWTEKNLHLQYVERKEEVSLENFAELFSRLAVRWTTRQKKKKKWRRETIKRRASPLSQTLSHSRSTHVQVRAWKFSSNWWLLPKLLVPNYLAQLKTWGSMKVGSLMWYLLAWKIVNQPISRFFFLILAWHSLLFWTNFKT